MSAVSFGRPDGSHDQRPLFFDERIELVGTGIYDMENMPIPFTGLNKGTGLANAYPAVLKDGLFMSPSVVSSRYTDDEAESMGFPTVADPSSGRYGSDFYDYAADGNRHVLMVFTGNTEVVSGVDNTFHQYNTATDPYDPSFDAGPPVTPEIDVNWDAGNFSAQAITGIRGTFDVWIPASMTAEKDLSGYAANDTITISKGRIKKAASTNVIKGRVKRKFTSGNYTKILVTVNTDGEAVKA